MATPPVGYTAAVDGWWWIVVAVVAVAVLIVVALLVWSRTRARRRTARLRARFGPEYETAVHRFGPKQGEQHLEELLVRGQSLRTREITSETRVVALRSFEAVQASFVDSPVSAVRAADQLVYDVLRERGYPLETVDQRAEALSLEEPELASRYRDAHAVLTRAESANGSDLNRLRDALLTYRDLLYQLVGAPRAPDRLRSSSPTDTTG